MTTRPAADVLPRSGAKPAAGDDAHVLLNALNAISTLLLRDGEHRAEAALTDFARLLRQRLGTGNFYRLEDEIEDFEAYLRIAALRFPGRVRHRTRFALRRGDLSLTPVAAMVGTLCDAPEGPLVDLALTARERNGVIVMRVALAPGDGPAIAEAFAAMLARCRETGRAHVRALPSAGAHVGLIRWGGGTA